jgi:hypothetical protein
MCNEGTKEAWHLVAKRGDFEIFKAWKEALTNDNVQNTILRRIFEDWQSWRENKACVRAILSA